MSYQKITIDQYLAYSDPDTQQAIMDLIRSRGYEINPRTNEELADDIAQFCLSESDGLEMLAIHHPDRALILRTAKSVGADAATQPATANMQAVHGIAPPVNNNQQPAAGNNTPIIAGLLGVIVLGMLIIAKK